MKLNRLFVFLVSFLLTGIVVTGVVGGISAGRLGGMLTSVVDKDLVRFLLVTEVRKNIRSQLVLTKDYILAANDAERSKIQESLTKAKKDSLSKLSEYEAMVTDDNRKSFNDLRESYKSVLEDELLVIQKVAEKDSAGAAIISKRKKGNPTWEDAIKNLINSADKSLQDEITTAKSFKTTSVWAIGTTLAGAVFLGIIVGGMIYRRITKNIETMLVLQTELKAANQDLEMKIEERTRAISRILSNVRSGFFLVGKDFKIQDGFTKSCRILFEKEIAAGQEIADILQLSGREKEHYLGCLSQVFEDFLPEETSLGQTPQVFMFGDRALKLEGSVIRGPDQTITEVLFTVTDVSKLMESEKEIHLSKAIIKILQERESFASFIVDTRKAFETGRVLVKSKDDKKLRMILHTIKGNSSAFGLTAVAALVHEIEDKTELSIMDLNLIETQIKQFLTQNSAILKLAYDDDNSIAQVTVGQDRLKMIELTMENAPSKNAAVESFKAWMIELAKRPVKNLLGPVQDLVKGLGERLGKDVELKIVGENLLVDPDMAGPIVRNLIHVLRNSVDHGLESPFERGDKPALGTVKVEFYEDSTHWGAKISDDGRGINVAKVKKAAIAKGMISPQKADALSEDEAKELLFAEGFSTADSTTDISGRGVGMGAMRKAAESAGGKFYIANSAIGVGTTFIVHIPKNVKRKSRTSEAA